MSEENINFKTLKPVGLKIFDISSLNEPVSSVENIVNTLKDPISSFDEEFLSSLNETLSSVENLINRLNADGNITYPDFKFNFFEDYANNTRTDTNS